MMGTDELVTSIPAIDRREAKELAGVEYHRLLDLLRQLDATGWSVRTECELWDVRAMVAHIVGAMEANTSIRENVHQQLAARKRPEPYVADRLSAVQVDERATMSWQQLLARYEALIPKAVKGRARVPGPFRSFKIKVDGGPTVERWTLAYLLDVIYTRDVWMHRVDISRATGREMVVTPEHDGRVVADVVAEWARRHGQPVTLELTGPAGGRFVSGDGGESLTLDAVEFCRIVSGRAAGDGLLKQEVPF